MLSANKVPENIRHTILWNLKGIVFIDFAREIVNSSQYYPELLHHSKDEVQEKSPHSVKKKILFYNDNVSANMSRVGRCTG